MLNRLNNRSFKRRLRELENKNKRRATQARLGGIETLEERRLLAAQLVTPFQQLSYNSANNALVPVLAPIGTPPNESPNGDLTQRVTTVFSKVPNGPDSALVLATNWTDSNNITIRVEVDNDGDGLFSLGAPETRSFVLSTAVSGAFAAAGGEGIVTTASAGAGGISSAIYVLPLGSSATDRLSRVTVTGGASTEHVSTAAIYQGIHQTNPVDDSNFTNFSTAPFLTTGSSIATINGGNNALDGGNVLLDSVMSRYGSLPSVPMVVGAGQTERLNVQTTTSMMPGGPLGFYRGGASNDGALPTGWTFGGLPGADLSSQVIVELNQSSPITVVNYDFGDAPMSYQVAVPATAGAARHATTDGNGNAIVGAPFFGPAAPDAEAAPTTNDNTIGADEGGITYGNSNLAVPAAGVVGALPVGPSPTLARSGPLATGMFVSQSMGTSTGYVTLDIQGVSMASPGYLSAYVDWNADGDFNDAGEQIIAGTTVTATGQRTFPVTIPTSAALTPGASWLRVRIHEDSCDTGILALGPNGFANDGEVEDHAITLIRGTEIHGFKFEDQILPGTIVPGGATLTAGDTPLNGVSINLGAGVIDIFGNPVGPVLTGDSPATPAIEVGQFWFNYLTAGTYTVNENLAASDINGDGVFDNTQGLVSSGPNSFPFSLVQGAVVADADGNPFTPNPAAPQAPVFLNYVTGSIHGFKFEDIDGSRTFNEDNPATPLTVEGALAGVKFNLYRYVGSTPVVNAPPTHQWMFVQTVMTNAAGRFDFANLPTGQYAIREDLAGSTAPVDATWVQSTAQPTGGFVFTGAIGSTQTNNIDPAVAANAVITVQSRQEYVFQAGASEVLGTPTANDLKVEFVRNSNTGLDPLSLLFGDYEPVTITGQKYHDLNGNGTLDSGEPGYANVRFELLLGGVPVMFPNTAGPVPAMVPYVLTNGAGVFTFPGVVPGTYTIRESLVQDTNGDLYDDIAIQDFIRDPRTVMLTVGSQAVVNVSTGAIAPVGQFTLAQLAIMVDDDGPTGPGAPVLVTTANASTTLTPWFNFVQGSIHGVKFHDINGNGLLDDTFDHDGDDADNDGFVDGVVPPTAATPQVYAGLPGVQFQIFRYDGTQTVNPATYNGLNTIQIWTPVGNQVSDAHGEFWFTDLNPGRYIVRENLPASPGPQPAGLDPLSTWVQTSRQGVGSPVAVPGPNGSAGASPNSADAIVIQSGREFQWDTNTPNLSGQVAAVNEQVYQRPMDGVTLVTSAPTINPATGLYTASFGTSVVNGNFELNEINAALIHTALKTPVTPEVGNVTTALPNSLRFGNVDPITITGFKFEDQDGDGVFEPADGDVPMAGVVFVLTGTTNNGTTLTTAAAPTAVIPFGEVTAVTNAMGVFTFTGVIPGTYTVQERGFQDLDPDGAGPKTSDGINDLLQGLVLSAPYTISTTSGVNVDLRIPIPNQVDDDADPTTDAANDDDDPDTLDPLLVRNFGNYFTGSIHGVKFEDLDGDGIFDDTRFTTPLSTLVNAVIPGQLQITIPLADVANFATNTVPFQLVINQGDLVNQETVTVTAKNANVFTISAATKFHAAGQSVTGPATTQIPAVIPGVVFTLYLAEATFVVDPATFRGPYTLYQWRAVKTAVSDSHGEFWFTGLEPGRYSVRETPGLLTQSTQQPLGNPNSTFDFSRIGDQAYVNSFPFETAFLGDNPAAPASGTLTVRSRLEFQWEDDVTPGVGFEGPGVFSHYQNQAYVRAMDGIGGPADGFISSGERARAVVLAAFKIPVTIPTNPAVAGPQNSLIYGNFTPITISGTKLNALSYIGDEINSSFPLPGIVMNLTGTDGLGNPVNLTAVTDASGIFAFSDLAPGTYSVSEGLVQDLNNDGIDDVASQGLVRDTTVRTVTVTSGIGFDFSDLVDDDNNSTTPPVPTYQWVNYITTSIHGRKFHDLNADGIANDLVDHDLDDLNNDGFKDGVIPQVAASPQRQAILQGVAFELYRYLGSSVATPATNPNGPPVTTFNWEIITTQFSDVHGDFWFTGLKPGIYTVRENLSISPGFENYIPSTGQAQGSPIAGQDLVTPNPQGDNPSLDANSALLTFNVSVVPGGAAAVFGGFVTPAYRNVAQAYPTPTAPAVVPVFAGSELQWQNGAYNLPMDTDGSGTISAAEILAADVSTRLKQGFIPDAGPNGERSLLFGNFLPVDIEGDKFLDLNGDGILNGTEAGMPNVTFVLYDASTNLPVMKSVPNPAGPIGSMIMVPVTAKTDAAGHFLFEDVKPGNYRVFEASPTNPGVIFAGGLGGANYVLQDTNGDFIDDVAFQDLTLANNSGPSRTVISAQNFNFSTPVDGDSNPATPLAPTFQWFNYVDGSIHGVKFDDLNGNGLFDDFVTATRTSTTTQPILSTSTFITVANASLFPTAAGAPYSIQVTGLNAAGQTVSEFMTVTARSLTGNNRLTVTRTNPVAFVTGATVVGQATNPATQTPAIVEGVAFELYKLSGTRVVDPPTFTGPFTIFDWTLVEVEFSDNHGEYWFTDLMPGTYTVRENLTRRGLTVAFDPANLPTDQQAIVIDGVVYEFEDVVAGNGLSNPANVQVSFGPATNAAGFAAALAAAAAGASNPYFSSVNGNSVTLSDADGITTTATDANGVTLTLTADRSGFVQSTTQAQGSPMSNVPSNTTGFNFLMPGVDLGDDPSLPGTSAYVLTSSQEYVYETDAHIMPVDGRVNPNVGVIGNPSYDPTFRPGIDGVVDGNLDRFEKLWATQKQALKTPILVGAQLQYGNFLPVSITGIKFEDLNGDGVKNDSSVVFDHDGNAATPPISEPGFAGIVFVLIGNDGAGNPVVTASGGALTAVTDSDGKFTFTGLRPGTYTISEASFQDTNVIDPNNGKLGATGTRPSKFGSPDGINDTTQGLVLSGLTPTITVTSGGNVNFDSLPDPDGAGPLGFPEPVMWANYITGSIHGFKFQDYDRDGVLDLGPAGTAVAGTNGLAEPVLSGVLFELWKFIGSTTVNQFTNTNFNRYNWEKVDMIESDVHGDFWFTGLMPGFYVVRENLELSTAQNLKQYSGQDDTDPSQNVLDSLGNIISHGEVPTVDPANGRFQVLSRQEYGYKPDAAYMPVDANNNGVFDLPERVLARNNIALKIQINVGTDLQFGNNFIPGAIHGLKFEDVNGNGVYNGPTSPLATDGEPGLPNILVGLLDSSGKLAVQADGNFALTPTRPDDLSTPNINEAGYFEFTNLVPGTYTLVEYLNAVPITPGSSTFVPATNTGVKLPNRAGTTTPYQLSDSNYDGIADGLQGMGQTTIQSAVAVGPLQALAWKPGASLMSNGQPFTIPNDSEIVFTEVVVTGGGLLIGNGVSGSIHAFKFLDLNANGIYEPGPMMKEVPMPGVRFDLLNAAGLPVLGTNGLPRMATSDANGLVNFENLAPGTYTLRERLDLTDLNDMTGDGFPNGDNIPDNLQGLMASRPTSFTVTVRSRQEYVYAVGASGIGAAATRSLDPDSLVPPVASGTSIQNSFPNVNLQSVYADIFTAPVITGLQAVTPTSYFSGPIGQAYGHTPLAIPFPADLFAFPATSGGQSNVLRATFAVRVASASIDVIANDSSDVGQLVARFNDNTSQIVSSGVLDGNNFTGRSQRLTVNAPSGKWIVSVEAGGSPFHTADFANGGSTVGLDNLTYTTQTLKTEVLVGNSLVFGNYYAGGVVGVKVQQGSGLPAPGITLTLVQGGVVKYTAVTDATGKYDFGFVIPGIYSLQEVVPSTVLIAAPSVGVAVTHANVTSSDLALSNPVFGLQTESLDPNLRITNLIKGSIHGIRTGADGVTPTPGITVELLGLVNGVSTVLQTTVTGPDGEFHFENIDPRQSFASGSFIVRTTTGQNFVYAPHLGSGVEVAYAVGQGNVSPTNPNGQFEVVDPGLKFAGDTPGSIRGVVFADGAPVAGLTVMLTNSTGGVTPTTTNPNGTFNYVGLAPGNYTVTVAGQVVPINLFSGEEEVFSLSAADIGPGETATVNPALIFNLGASPKVTALRVARQDWATSFKNGIDPIAGVGYLIPTGSTAQVSPIGWANINQIVIDFSRHVTGSGAGGILVASDFAFSSDIPGITITGPIGYDPGNFRATLTLSADLPMDRYKVTVKDTVKSATSVKLDGEFVNSVQTYAMAGNGVPGGDFVFNFAVSPGNASFIQQPGDSFGAVNILDLGGVAGMLGQQGNTGYLFETDLNGNGFTDILDLGFVAGRLNLQLPAPSSPFSSSVDALFAGQDEEDELEENLEAAIAGLF